MGRLRIAQIAVALMLSALMVSAAHAGDGTARGGNRPELAQLSYEESNDGSSKRYNLAAYARRTDSVRFAVRKHGERLGAEAKFNKSVTDTDLPNGPVSHPWEIVRKGGGVKVLRQIRRSLNRRGEIDVRVRLKGPGGLTKDRVTIDVSDCSSDPPFYPLSCEI